MATVGLTLNSLNYDNNPPGSNPDAVSAAFGYGYGAEKGQIGEFFTPIANNQQLDLASGIAQSTHLFSVVQNESRPNSAAVVTGSGDYFNAFEGTGGYGTNNPDGTISDPHDHLHLSATLSVTYKGLTQTITVPAAVQLYYGTVSDTDVDYTLNFASQTLTFGADTVQVDFTPLSMSGNNEIPGYVDASLTLTDRTPKVAFTPGVTFKNAHTATLNGTASDPAVAVTGVEVFDNGTDLGAATLNGDGTWTLANVYLPSGNQNLTAVATNSAGTASPATPPPFVLETGIKGQPYSSYEEDFDNSSSFTPANFTGETYTKRNGAVYQQDTVVETLPNGDHQLDTFAGTYFNNQDFYYKSDVFSSDYSILKTETLYNNDGTHSVNAFVDGQILNSVRDDTMTGGGTNETFVFKPHFGQDVVTDFQAGGAGHDTLSLSSSEFADVAQVLSRTRNVEGSAVIHVDRHDSITLQNVTKAELRANQNDFAFHA